MIRFSAKYSALIDDKGRVVLPSALKKMMGAQADNPIAIEMDIYSNCLNIYPENYWNEKLEEIESKLNAFDEGDIELLEQFYENFTTVKMAANGRLNIPISFMEHANVKKEVVMIGMGKMIRLWDAEGYEKRKGERRPLRNMIKEKLGNKPEGD
jgi:MraZ protein